MDAFKKMDTLTHYPTKTVMTVEEYSKKFCNGEPVEVFKNSKYQVIRKPMGADLTWLSIKRIDKEPIHDWRDLQEIKNQLVGEECEGVEIYPAESRKVDAANQYHLWVFSDPKYRLPFGFKERLVGGPEEASRIGAKQR